MREFSLGEVIAEHECVFEPAVGEAQPVTIRIGRPVPDDEEAGAWACPYQIDGVGKGQVHAILGEGAMQALVLAVHTIPVELAVFVREGGGRYTRFGGLDTTFGSSCHLIVDLVSDAFPPSSG